MSIVDKKNKIFSKIAAAKTLTQGLPKLKISSLLSTINNGKDIVSFLTDLIKTLIGYKELIEYFVNIISNSLIDIEKKIKKALKFNLKSIVSCGVDPSIPSWFKSTGTGIVLDVSKVDFFDLFKTDITTKGGALLFDGANDFNFFLYNVIQDDGNMSTWKNIFDITFNSIGVGSVPNNTLTIKANSSYDNKTLTDINNDFIDTLTLFNSEGIVNRIIDIIFGSISVSVKKSTKQLEEEEKINLVIDNLIASETNDDINENYFTFTNEEVYVYQQKSDFRKRGITKLDCCSKISASIPILLLDNFNTEVSSSLQEQKSSVIAKHLDIMAEQTTQNSTNKSDKITIKVNFIQGLINNLIKAIIGVVLSPKVILIFVLNYKIIYGSSAQFSGAIDFIKKNKNLIKAIIKQIVTMIVKQLITIALKKISILVAAVAAKKIKQKQKARLAQISSLIGLSKSRINALKDINGL